MSIGNPFKWFAKPSHDDNVYYFKIAIFNAIAYLSVAVIDTYVEATLTMFDGFTSPRMYPWGYYVALLAIPISVGNYLIVRGCNGLHGYWGFIAKCCMPYLFTISFGVFMTYANFESPGFGRISAYCTYTLPGLLASFVRYYDLKLERLNDPNISSKIKIEWIKENLTLWRSLSLSSVFGFLAIAIPWFALMKEWIFVRAVLPEERSVAILFMGCQGAAVAVYVFCCPVYEIFAKQSRFSAALLDIKGTL